MKGRRTSSSRASAADTFASCIRRMVPSIMRSPPEPEMMLALGTDAPVRFQVFLPPNRAATFALRPQPFRLNAALVGRRGLIDPFFVSLEPGHIGILLLIEAHCVPTANQ